MKLINVDLCFSKSCLKQIKLSIIRKLKNKYYYDCVFKVDYQNEYLQDIIGNLIKKANLEKNDFILQWKSP